jgi:hypothetical protein
MLVPIVIGKIFRSATESLSAVMYSELVFIALAGIAIVISLVLKKSSKNHPELGLDEPNKVGK